MKKISEIHPTLPHTNEKLQRSTTSTISAGCVDQAEKADVGFIVNWIFKTLTLLYGAAWVSRFSDDGDIQEAKILILESMKTWLSIPDATALRRVSIELADQGQNWVPSIPAVLAMLKPKLADRGIPKQSHYEERESRYTQRHTEKAKRELIAAGLMVPQSAAEWRAQLKAIMRA